MPQEQKENEKITDDGSQVTEETPTIPTPGVGKGSKNKLAWWVLGVIVLVGIGYGGWYLGKLQNPNDKLQTNSKSQNPNIETPTSPAQSSSNPVVQSPTTPPDPTADLPAKDSSTADWKTYENKDYGFSFKYPKTVDAPDRSIKTSDEWNTYVIDPDNTNKNSGSEKWIYIGPETSRSGGFIWGVLVYDSSKKSIDSLMKESGSQFDDKKGSVENITIDGETWTLQTVTTNKYSDWVAKGLYLEKNNKIYYINNGAIGSGNISDAFNNFYKTFKFTK